MSRVQLRRANRGAMPGMQSAAFRGFAAGRRVARACDQRSRDTPLLGEWIHFAVAARASAAAVRWRCRQRTHRVRGRVPARAAAASERHSETVRAGTNTVRIGEDLRHCLRETRNISIHPASAAADLG